MTTELEIHLLPGYNYAPVALVWAGPDASLAPDNVEFVPYAYPVYSNVISTWNTVSIPAGESVVIMHFISQQASRDGAAASAQRLVALPPEALEGLSLHGDRGHSKLCHPRGRDKSARFIAAHECPGLRPGLCQ